MLQLPHVHSVSLAFMTRTGPRYERPSENGISHLVEHLVLRGTRTHPNSRDFHVAVEALGGEINGLTQRDASSIHVTVPPRHARAGLRLLHEACVEPLMTGIEVERNVVIEEILDTYDADGNELDPDAIARSIMWGDHPMGQPVAGTVDIVERLTPEACRAHFERTFVATNGILVIAGPVDPDLMFAEAARTFIRMPRGEPMPEIAPPVPLAHPPIHIQPTDDSQVTVMLSFPAPHENDPRFGALLLLKRVLDDGFGARLRQAICEQRGLAYTLSASVDAYADVGTFDVELACAETKVVTALEATLSTLSGLWDLCDAELVRAKTRHVAELEFALDAPTDIVGWYGAAALMGQDKNYEDWLRDVTDCTTAEVVTLAREVLDRRRALLTLVGPVEDEDVATLERLMARAPDSTLWLAQEEEEEPEAAEPPEEAEVRDVLPFGLPRVRLLP